MRITNNTMVSNYLREVQSQTQKVSKLNEQISTQKQINKVSDDPQKAIKIMTLKNEMKYTEKYNSNCDEMVGYLDTVYETLENVTSLVTDIKTSLTSVSDLLSSSEIKGIAQTINGKIEELGKTLNNKYIGNNLFSGSATSSESVSVAKDINGKVTLTINGAVNDERLSVNLSDGISYDYNLTISEVLGQDGVEVLKLVNSALEGDEVDFSKVEEAIKSIDSFLDKSLVNRTIVSIKANTVESIKNANTEGLEKLEKAHSLMQDIDMVEKYVELSNANLVYQSMMQVGSKIIQPTILDYLR